MIAEISLRSKPQFLGHDPETKHIQPVIEVDVVIIGAVIVPGKKADIFQEIRMIIQS